MKYIIVHIFKNGIEKYVTHHQLENGTWRSENIQDARRFETRDQAEWFVKNKLNRYPINYRIEQINI